MYKQIAFHGAINERTGYGIHGSRWTEALSKLIPVNFNGEGDIHISLLDVVTAAHTTVRHPYPSILFTVWESSEYPAEFMDKLRLYDMMFVPSEWQRACSIAQGVPEEFIHVIPEGVDPDIYKPLDGDPGPSDTFNFLHVGQFQRRKSTREICQAFLKAFPDNPNVRLYLSVDTLYPSDPYKTTEERMAAYGFLDSRFCIVHFEERADYIRRLQNAHIFVTAARAEGWNLPLTEAIACGVPSIAADYSGSTEYAGDTLLVRVPKLEKPEGIYGDWKVPGMWGSPDYDHLVEVMRDAYENYATHKKKALITSDMIRTKFSWSEAAKKAYDIIQEIPECPVSDEVKSTLDLSGIAPIPQSARDAEAEIQTFARERGFEIQFMAKRKIIFTMDTHPDTPEKIQCLIESIAQVKALGYPLLLTSHCPLPANVLEMVDFHVYDKRDILSGDDRPTYWRTLPDGTTETTKSGIPCHALAATMNVRNGIDFCLGKYDWIYLMSSDCEVDLAEWVKKVQASDKTLIGCRWDHQENTFSGQLFAGTVDVMDKIIPRLESWEDFVKEYGDKRFNSEEGLLRRINDIVGPGNYDILDMDLGNRFDQVDREAWKDDVFQAHFVEGPFLNIAGLSSREYDVSFGNPIDGPNHYTLKQKAGMWSRPDKKFFREWTITARRDGEVKFQHALLLEGKNVLMSMGSKALGDTLAWIPYVEEFRKKHGCNIYLSTWWNHILDYPRINFIKPGDAVQDVYASYSIGCFDDQPNMNPINWRKTPLQKVAADILGLEYKPIRPRLKYEPYKKGGNGKKQPKPYICFSEFSTMKNKLWNNPGAWQKVINALIDMGYDCHSISSEQTQLTGVVRNNGQQIEQTLTDLSGAEFYIGLNAGPTWLAYALGVPAIMLDGVAEEWNSFPNPHRVSIDICKPGCFNNTDFPINRGWEWCPRDRDYQCTREITVERVLNEVESIRKEIGYASKKQKTKSRCSHSTSQPGKAVQKERRAAKDGGRRFTQVRGDQRERAAGE